MPQNTVEKEGSLYITNSNYKTFVLFSKQCYTSNEIIQYDITEEQKRLLTANGAIDLHKYRLYFKAVKNGHHLKTEENILTFIMFNPSTATHLDLDATLKNCSSLAKRKQFAGFEILNLLNIRNPSTSKFNVCSNDSNAKYNIEPIPIFKNVVLAWGYRDSSKNDMDTLNKNLQNILQYNKKETKYYTLEEGKTRHAGNQAWSRLGGFSTADLHLVGENIPKITILKKGRFINTVEIVSYQK